MNVKNIKSFIEFYESLGVSTYLSQSPRFSNITNNSNIQERVNTGSMCEQNRENKIYQLKFF